jgi:flagellar biosynthesis protein FliP
MSLLRTALGTTTAPPNAVIVSLALFLTAFVMGPGTATRLRHRDQASGRLVDGWSLVAGSLTQSYGA